MTDPTARDADLESAIARRTEVLDGIRGILVEAMHVERDLDEIDPDTPLFGTGLRLDSLDAVDLWVQVGLRFRLKPPEEAVRRMAAMRTLDTLADLILAERSVEDDENP
jgi:acyl carrier protein